MEKFTGDHVVSCVGLQPFLAVALIRHENHIIAAPFYKHMDGVNNIHGDTIVLGLSSPSGHRDHFVDVRHTLAQMR